VSSTFSRLTRTGGAALSVGVGPVSVLVRPRALVVGAAATGVAAALFVAALAIGTTDLPAGVVLAGLFGQGEASAVLTVQRLRLPRALVGLLVGLALGAAGALTQGMARNPLASPDVLGVTAGASAGAVAVLLAQGSSTAASGGASAEVARIGLPLGAVAGAAVAAALVLGLSTRRRTDGSGLDPHRLILVGVVLAAAFIGLVDYALIAGDVDQAARATVWLTGSLNGRAWHHVWAVAAALVVLLPLAAVLARRLDVLLLGDSVATALGIRAGRSRLANVAVAVALAGTATAAAGPVAFVALVAPNLARGLVRGPGVPLVTSALLGAGLLLAADLLARRLVPGTELPAGAVTALIGAPYLIFLLQRTRRSR
jgi:iron complex transport system permease protein